jgi:hypothetical protein
MQNVDPATHSATLHAQGSDKRGQGGATATISSRLSSAESATRIEVVTDYHITGRLARFGRGGMIEDISERLLREFAGRLQSSLSSPHADGAEVHSVAVAPATAAEASALPESAAPPTKVAAVSGSDGLSAPPAEAAPPEEAEPPAEPGPPPPPAAASPPPPTPLAGETPPPQAAIEPSPPLQGVSLIGSVIIDRVKRNPKPLIALAGGLLVWRLARRRR